MPPDCPVLPLGMGEGVRFYLNGARQLVGLKIKEHTRLEVLGLFGEYADMVYEIWPKTKTIEDEHGNKKTIVVGWDTAAAEEQLLRLTAAKRLWSPFQKARGRGCWLGDDGGLVVNTGTAVLIDGKRQRPGLMGEYVMTAREGIMTPAPLAEPGGERGVGAELLALLQTWQWKRPIDARLKLRLIGCRFLGAALRERPVEWDIGPRNTGKSTLQNAEADLMGGWLVALLDPTTAAIRQLLQHDCLPVAIDEAEPDSDKENRRRLAELIKLARMAYSGGKVARGGSDGEPTDYVLRSAMLFRRSSCRR
ncbi:MAG: hypothetical protein JO305_05015 [Alphaproteobacteria bacterium]|nr:hypothetical protein [Alphaproteobacteria bacterium]